MTQTCQFFEHMLPPNIQDFAQDVSDSLVDEGLNHPTYGERRFLRNVDG